MNKFPIILALLSFSVCGVSQAADLTENSIVTTFAGAAHTFSGDGGAALNATLSGFQQLQTDRNGNVIFADTGNQVVSRLNSDGTITVLAGNGIVGFSGEGGPARSASLNFPSDAVMDKAGNLYIYDSFNFRIRRVTPDGTISTYAGTGVEGYAGDGGPASQAQIELDGKMAIDAAGNLYFTDGVDSVVRQITPGGTVSTYAGNGMEGHSGDNGPATKASLGLVDGGLALDTAGNLYVAEDAENYIRKIAPDGTISTFAGSGMAGFMNGPATAAQFYTPFGLALDAGGDLFVADVNNGLIRKISPAGIVSTFAGTPVFGFSGDGGPALAATFRFAEGVTVAGDGRLYIEDNGNFRIRAVSSDGTIQTVAGDGQFQSTPDGTPAANASLLAPDLLSFDPSGRLLIADPGNFTVRRINSNGEIQTIAGFGVQGVGLGQGPVYQLAYGGPATETLLGTPRQAVADGQGNIYASDDYAGVVYKITPDGILNVFAGQVGVYQFGGDNIQATSSSFVEPEGIALDQSGNLYIADAGDNRVRKVATDGTITTFAGTGTAGFSGDGSAANEATLNFPQSIVFDSKGDLIIADRGNNRLRMVTPDGNISTIAGNGTRASTGNGGPATAASLIHPFVVTADSAGNIFLIESTGTTVRRISPDGIISLVAGNGLIGFGGDGGPAVSASFSGADGLAVDSSGNLYISDSENRRIRLVLAATPTLTATPSSLSFLGTSGGVVTDPQAIIIASSLPGLQVTASSDSGWLQVPASIAYAPGSISVSANPSGLAPGTYQGTVSLGSPGITSVLSTVHVTFRVNSSDDPKLATDTPTLTFSLTTGGAPQSQPVRVLNAGAGQIAFFVDFAGAGSAGLSSSIQQGTTQANAPATVSIVADPTKLPVGTTSASLLILGTNLQYVTVPVTITVSPSPKKMALSRGGFTFIAVPGGGVTPPQSFSVLNTGTGTFSWTAQATTITTGNWLSITPDNGSSSPGDSGSVTVSVNPAGLDPGVYYGLVQVISPGTVNAPQQVEVVLNILAPAQSTGATVSPSGLIFTTPEGGDSPSSQTFKLTNLSATPAPLSLKVTTTGGDWLVVAPDNGSIAPGVSQTITVQPQSGSLAAGVYQGTIALQAGGAPLTVNVLFVVVPSVAPAGSARRGHDVTPASCAPSKLYPVFTSLTTGFVIPASWPLPIAVQVVDDCGNPMTSGRVATDFSNGDPRLSLMSLQNGQWEGIWFGHNLSASQIVITANADMDSPVLHGQVPFTGMLAPNPNVPSVNSSGVTSGVGPSGGQPSIAPGDLITISGQYFAAAPTSAVQLPLTPDLGATEVLLAGAPLPLIYSSSGAITAIVPYNLAPNSQYQVIVSRGGAISGPQAVTVGTAQPSILQIDATGSASVAQNLWNLVTAGTPVDPTSKALAPPALKSGGNLVIYCAGLGPIDQTLDPSTPAPAMPPINTANAVTLSMGGQNVPVTFAGLVPGYPGIYEVTATVPSGLVAASNVAVTVSVAGQTSSAVPVTIQ